MCYAYVKVWHLVDYEMKGRKVMTSYELDQQVYGYLLVRFVIAYVMKVYVLIECYGLKQVSVHDAYVLICV